MLLKEGVWDIVDGSTPRPSIDKAKVSEKDQAAFKAQVKDWDAKSTILLCIDLSYQHRFSTIPTAPKIWTTLAKRYGSVSRTRRCQYRAAFWNASHNPSLHVDTYINTVVAAACQLQQIDIDISDDNIAETIVYNLDTSWQAIKAPLMESKSLTLDEVETQAVNHQQHLDGDQIADSTIEAANAVRG